MTFKSRRTMEMYYKLGARIKLTKLLFNTSFAMIHNVFPSTSKECKQADAMKSDLLDFALTLEDSMYKDYPNLPNDHEFLSVFTGFDCNGQEPEFIQNEMDKALEWLWSEFHSKPNEMPVSKLNPQFEPTQSVQ